VVAAAGKPLAYVTMMSVMTSFSRSGIIVNKCDCKQNPAVVIQSSENAKL